MDRKKLVSLSIVAVAVIAASGIYLNSSNNESGSSQSKQVNVESELSAPQDRNIQVTNGEKHIVALDKINSGGPPKDGIPSIDNPKFATVSEADFMSEDDIVIGVKINGQTKAYPLFILVWHEIVNDKVGSVPVAVTYCPLCYTSQVFERKLQGQTVEFGTSGKLYNSNLVMYDRLTNTYWSQALGTAIKGEMAGHRLDKIPFDLMEWKDWKSLYPDTLVLTTDTGHIRSYGSDPYGSYYTDSRIMFSVEHRDGRMHPKEIIVGIEDKKSQEFKAYKMEQIESAKVINDSVAGDDILLVSTNPHMARVFDRNLDGNTLTFEYSDNGEIVDKETESKWGINGTAVEGKLKGAKLQRLATDPGFWFEWVAFHPDTKVYQDPT